MLNNILLEINKSINIELDKELMSPIDTIKIIKDILGKRNIKKIIKMKMIDKNPNSNEKFILDIMLDKRFYNSILLSQNHTRNLFHDIYFIISNPELYSKKFFK